MEEYKELLSKIKQALEQLDYSEEYEEHRYLQLEDRIVEIIKEVLCDPSLTPSQQDILFKGASMILGWYIETRSDVERYLPQIHSLLTDQLITQAQYDFFQENMNIEWEDYRTFESDDSF
ncbi:MAG: hypothetical protein J1E99_06115 [Muribaculaceae bacterium]|nr:hypothetical protein [Muribaculaceae bacterium]